MLVCEPTKPFVNSASRVPAGRDAGETGETHLRETCAEASVAWGHTCACARTCGFCISVPAVSCRPPCPPAPSAPRSLSSYYSHSALEGRQRTLNALCCLLHCLCCFSVPVPHSLPIFVFINHNGRLPRVS